MSLVVMATLLLYMCIRNLVLATALSILSRPHRLPTS